MPWKSKNTGPPVDNGWKDWISLYDSNVVVSLSHADLCDADLESLMTHLDKLLTRDIWPKHWTYSLDLDLSCNCGITDFGVTVHIMGFLGKWPACRRLKLYQTSIGDAALQALSPWIASGNAHELHLSDLYGTVTGGTVLRLLRAIHWEGKYPYWTQRGEQAALWLRLEHNGISNPDQLVSAAEAEGIWVQVVEKSDLSFIRPGSALARGSHYNASINLVLFRMQNQKAPKQHAHVNGREALLTMLQPGGPSSSAGLGNSEPLPLSVDEFQLWVMETREDIECGANARNKDTFGHDADAGWSFEENLAANERLSGGTPDRNIAAVQTPPPSSPQRKALDASLDVSPMVRARAGQSQDELEAVYASRRERRKIGPANPRLEIEEEVQAILIVNPVLRRFDFDGSVRQHLHAIRSIGGRAFVEDAMDMIHGATKEQDRKTIQKWPAYLVTLLKPFARSLKDPQANPSRTTTPVASPALRAAVSPAVSASAELLQSPFSKEDSDAASWLNQGASDIASPNSDAANWLNEGVADAAPSSGAAAWLNQEDPDATPIPALPFSSFQ